MGSVKVRRHSLEHDLRNLRRSKDGWYRTLYSLAGGARPFRVFLGSTRAEAERALRAQYRIAQDPPLPTAVDRRVRRAMGAFRKRDLERFNKAHKVAFYTDYPERFSGAQGRNYATTRAFDLTGARYDLVSSETVLEGGLTAYAMVFAPGGFGYFPGPEIKRAFRNYVRNGGGFLGFCAGGFFPLREQLGLLSSSFAYFREQGFPYIIMNPRDPLARGLRSTVGQVTYAHAPMRPAQRHCTLRLRMFRGNGPLFKVRGRDRAVAYYDTTEDYAAVIRGRFGAGRVVASGPHPDCTMTKLLESTGEQNLIENLKLMKNMILYGAGAT